MKIKIHPFDFEAEDFRTVGEVMDDAATPTEYRDALNHNIQVRAIGRGMTLGDARQILRLRWAAIFAKGAR